MEKLRKAVLIIGITVSAAAAGVIIYLIKIIPHIGSEDIKYFVMPVAGLIYGVFSFIIYRAFKD